MKKSIFAILALLTPGLALAAQPGLDALTGANRVLVLVLPEAGRSANLDARIGADCDHGQWLSDSGRAKMERIGAILREEGLAKAPVFTSPSCTAVQAGESLRLGAVGVQPLLQDIEISNLSRNRQRQELGLFLADFYGNPPFVLVTHRNNVLDMSARYVDPGNGIVLRINLNGDASEVLSVVQFD